MFRRCPHLQGAYTTSSLKQDGDNAETCRSEAIEIERIHRL